MRGSVHADYSELSSCEIEYLRRRNLQARIIGPMARVGPILQTLNVEPEDV
jgi:hypothetical protein